MDHHMKNWLDFLEKKLLGRLLQPGDHIFPHLGANATVDPSQPVSADVIQQMIQSFTADSGIKLGSTLNFTTHCFRRGGAQYRFIFAPIAQRWNLAAMRWWGGWAEGENVCNLHSSLKGIESYNIA
jgi:hypothetical protein